MILEIIQGNLPLLYTTISQPYYYSHLYIQVRKNEQKLKSVVENLETINHKLPIFSVVKIGFKVKDKQN